MKATYVALSLVALLSRSVTSSYEYESKCVTLKTVIKESTYLKNVVGYGVEINEKYSFWSNETETDSSHLEDHEDSGYELTPDEPGPGYDDPDEPGPGYDDPDEPGPDPIEYPDPKNPTPSSSYEDPDYEDLNDGEYPSATNTLAYNPLETPGYFTNDTGPSRILYLFENALYQSLTAPVIAIHKPDFELFDIGANSTWQVTQLAENGNNLPLLQLLAASKGVVYAAEAKAPVSNRSAVSFHLDLDPSIDLTGLYLTTIARVMDSNDGFVGTTSAPINLTAKGDQQFFKLEIYDNGSEKNDKKDCDHAPLEGCTTKSSARELEYDVIRPHPDYMNVTKSARVRLIKDYE